jgi:hypothetical protein
LIHLLKGEAALPLSTNIKVMQMTINHAGTLRKDYFVSYMKLIMNACGCSIEEAKDRTFERLFRLKENEMGQETFTQFLLAYQELMVPPNE